MTKECIVLGCDRPVIARGMCRPHYRRWQDCCDPAKPDTRGNTEADFWSKVLVGEDDECWLWQKAKDQDGYGFFWWKNQQVRAHRFSWELFGGAIPDGLHVLHGCDNPSCVNPTHLFLGTTQDNTADRDSKERQVRGEGHPLSVLTEDEVIEIRVMASEGASKRQLARLFKVHSSTIYNILKRKKWKHVQ